MKCLCLCSCVLLYILVPFCCCISTSGVGWLSRSVGFIMHGFSVITYSFRFTSLLQAQAAVVKGILGRLHPSVAVVSPACQRAGGWTRTKVT